jgi:hypothetical protein
MTKLLVMSEGTLDEQFDDWCWSPEHRDPIAVKRDYLPVLQSFRAAMTVIDIPGGCKLAVVRMADIPVGTYGVSDANKYRRVVQEVM